MSTKGWVIKRQCQVCIGHLLTTTDYLWVMKEYLGLRKDDTKIVIKKKEDDE